MEITVRYTGQLAGAAGRSEETVSIGKETRLKDLLDGLARNHGPDYADLVFAEDGRLRPSLLIIFDGEQAGGERESLEVGGVRTLMLMPPIAGG